MENRIGIEETRDLLEYAEKIVDKMLEAKSDDGKISKSEIISAVISTAPAGIQAFSGVDEVVEELKELSPEEQKEVVEKSILVVKKLIGLFMPEILDK